MTKYQLQTKNSDTLEDAWLWMNNKVRAGKIRADITHRDDGLYPSPETIVNIYECARGEIEIRDERDRPIDISPLDSLYVSAFPYRGEITNEKAAKFIRKLRSENRHLTANKSLFSDLGISLTEGDKPKRFKSLEQIMSELNDRLSELPRKQLQEIIQSHITEVL